MKKYQIHDYQYELIENYKDGFLLEEVIQKITDYFDPYDYIVGDWAYGKLRLKGFCEPKNEFYRKSNDIKEVKKYLKEFCAYECKYFILKKCYIEGKNK